jgi:hypothetical protein
MLIRRIAVTACALCIAAPGVARAQPIHDPLPGHADHFDRRGSPDNRTPGDAFSQLSRANALDDEGGQRRRSEHASNNRHVDRVGSLTARQLAAYGTTKPATAAHASIASADDGTNDWRIAAVTEAALLAALALASALIVRARRRAPRIGCRARAEGRVPVVSPLNHACTTGHRLTPTS